MRMNLLPQFLDGRFRRWCAGMVIGAACAVAIYAPDPDRYQRSLLELHEFLHVPGFAFIMIILIMAFPGAAGESGPHRWGRLILLFCGAIALGGAVELLQAARGGTADVGDVLRDAAGAATTALIAASLGHGHRLSARWLPRMIAVTIVGVSLVPLSVALVDETRARRQFPILADFSTRSEMDRFSWSRLAIVSRERAVGPDKSRHVMRLTLLPGRYPGFSLKFFPRDWRGWREFVLVCSNLGRGPIPLTVRIDDLAHNHDYYDRFNRTFSLQPGRNEVRIPLADVQSAPRGRSLDLGQIQTVIAFSANLSEPGNLLLYELRLAP